jgi:hypothetical protein
MYITLPVISCRRFKSIFRLARRLLESNIEQYWNEHDAMSVLESIERLQDVEKDSKS